MKKASLCDMSKQLLPHLGFAALLAVSFIVLFWPFGYIITYQSETNDCLFMFGRPFLLEFFDHPAGPLRYAGRFLGQFYHYRWLGALIVSACITCFGLLFRGVLAKLKKETSISQTLLPCVLLLALHTSSIYVIYDTLGACVSCGAFLGYLWCRGKTLRRLYALAATPILYFVLGFYFWFFVVWVAVFEWLDSPIRSGLLFDIIYAAVSLGAPLFAWRWVYVIPWRSAVLCPILFGPPYRTGSPPHTVLQAVMDGFMCLLLYASLLLIPFWGASSANGRPASVWPGRLGGRRALITAAAFCVLLVLLGVVRYDERLSTYVAFRQLYKQRQWDALLEKAKGLSFEDLRLQFMTNFALCQKRRLLDEMFTRPQEWGARGLILNVSGKIVADPSQDDSFRAMYNSDLFYEMGHVNLAFRHAYNYMYDLGETYDALQRMAQCSMANGNLDMAAKYLNKLERTVFHRDFARRYRAIMADPEAMRREFKEIRERLPTVEDEPSSLPVLPLLTLLRSRPDNRMAFDYLMAWYLLDRTLIRRIPERVEQFRSVGCASLPLHCQEALLLFERQTDGRVDLKGFNYDEQTRARVDGFLQEVFRYRGRPDLLQQLRPLYGDMYLFYYFTTPEDARRQPPGGGFGGGMREE